MGRQAPHDVFDRALRGTNTNTSGRQNAFPNTPDPTPPSSEQYWGVVPRGLTAADGKTLVRVQHRAYQLDEAFGSLCGIKFGWSSVIAIAPGIGDMLDMLLAVLLIRAACEVGLPARIKFRMAVNVAFDFVVGLVPILGDLLDVGFKANSRNAGILASYLRKRGDENLRREMGAVAGSTYQHTWGGPEATRTDVRAGLRPLGVARVKPKPSFPGQLGVIRKAVGSGS